MILKSIKIFLYLLAGAYIIFLGYAVLNNPFKERDFSDMLQKENESVCLPKSVSDPVGSDPVGSGQVGSDPVGSDPVGSDPVGSGQVGGEPIGSGQVGGDPVGSGQVGGGQVGSDPVGGKPGGSDPVKDVPADSVSVEGTWMNESGIKESNPGTLRGDTVTKREKRTSLHLPMKKCIGTESAETDKRVAAITFDDGPSIKHTPEILDILKEHNVKATFFIVGEYVKYYPGLTKRIFEEGHIIGNHSYYHPDFKNISGREIEEELTKTSKSVQKITGRYPLLFRPPYGHCNDTVNQVVKDLGFKMITWSVMTDDYKPEIKAEEIKKEILNKMHPGAIIGLHDGGGDRTKTVKALPEIIRALQEQGYELVTIPELLNIEPYI